MPHSLKVPEIPEPLRDAPAPFRLEPPMVFVPPIWEYKHLVRPIVDAAPIGEEELNALGQEAWELSAVYTGPASVHFYFRRLIR